MTKHVLDQPHQNSGTRLREFTRAERESGVHPAVDILRSRPLARGEENRQAAEFLRIEREEMR